jgi:alcohol dehydrogenase
MGLQGIFPTPFPVGHEIVAEVIDVGRAVGKRHVGERVIVPFQLSCGECNVCRSGRFGAWAARSDSGPRAAATAVVLPT